MGSKEAIKMTTEAPPTIIPKVALRALSELTGEPRFDVALFITLRDAVEHRLEKKIFRFSLRSSRPLR
jgi:hypothetical protein